MIQSGTPGGRRNFPRRLRHRFVPLPGRSLEDTPTTSGGTLVTPKGRRTAQRSVPAIARGVLAVIEGRAPIWRYGLAFHRLHGSPAGAIAVYDPRLGAVVVASHHPDWREGDVIDVTPPRDVPSLL